MSVEVLTFEDVISLVALGVIVVGGLTIAILRSRR